MRFKNIVPKITLKVHKIDGNVETIVTKKKKRVWSKVTREPGLEWYLRVTYGPGINNSWTSKNKREIIEDLSVWTSKDQIKAVEDREW